MHGQPGIEGIKRHRLGDAIALHMIASELCQKRVLSRGFNAFRQGVEVQPVSKAENGGQDAPLLRIVADPGYESCGRS